MKRYIRTDSASKKQYTTSYKVGTGIVKGLDDEVYGELEHKRYRGLEIRDFRNGWLGDDDFTACMDVMDVFLEAYDKVCDSNPDMMFEPRFFNIRYDDLVELRFTFIDSSNNQLSGAFIQWRSDDYGVEFSARSASGLELDADVLSRMWDHLRSQHDKQEASAAKRRATVSDRNSSKIKELRAQQFNDIELTVPVKVEIGENRSNYLDIDVPDDASIVANIEQVVPIEDVNRYIRNITVRFMLSGTSICLYPKLSAARLRVDSTGDTRQVQLRKACTALRKKVDRYMDELATKNN